MKIKILKFYLFKKKKRKWGGKKFIAIKNEY